MYKNQLQELAQRSCFNLPSYSCIREGPDHAPRFKASVNFNGDIFSSPTFCTTLRQAEHSAAQVALNALSSWGPSKSLAARILDETGVYKNLLQGTAYRAGLKLPVYTTVKSGPAHVPVFTTTVELAGMSFTGDSAKTKKQAEKNAAISAWISLKTMPNTDLSSGSDQKNEEADCGGGDQVAVTKALSNFRKKDGGKQQIMRKDQNRRKVKKNASLSNINSPKYQFQTQREPIDLLMGSVAAAAPQSPTRQTESSFASFLPPPPPPTASKILPLTSSQVPQIEVHKGDNEFDVKKGANPSNPIYRPIPPLPNPVKLRKTHPILLQHEQTHASHGSNFTPPPLVGAPLPGWHRSRGMMSSGGGFQPHRIAPAVQIRTIIPVCSAPPPARPLNPPLIKEASPSQAQTGTQVSSPSSSSSSSSFKLDKLHL